MSPWKLLVSLGTEKVFSKNKTLMIGISQSGETADTLAAFELAEG